MEIIYLLTNKNKVMTFCLIRMECSKSIIYLFAVLDKIEIFEMTF